MGAAIFIFIVILVIVAVCYYKIINEEQTTEENNKTTPLQEKSENIQKSHTAVSNSDPTNLLMQRVLELLREKDALQARIEELENELAESNRTCEDSELQKVRRTNRELKDENRALQEQIKTLSAQTSTQASCVVDSEQYITQIHELKSENQSLQERISNLEHQLIDTTDFSGKVELQKITNINHRLTSENEELQKQINQLQEECKKAGKVSPDEIPQKLKNIIVFLERENQILKKRNEELMTAHPSLGIAINHFEDLRAELADAQEQLAKYTANGDFRKRYPAHYRTHDGHWVRSKIEREIANFLYDHKIRYEFEREYVVPNTKITYYPDFYLPDHHLFIEYFGKEDPEYVEKRETKKQHYARDSRYRFEYVSFDDDYLLEEHLKEILRRHGIIY